MNRPISLIFVFLLVCFGLTFQSNAQLVVYPVGNPNGRPTKYLPNSNGYRITQGFPDDTKHTGVDLANGTVGQSSTEGGEVRAIADGEIFLKKTKSDSVGFGNVIMIKHTFPCGTFYSLYAHLQDNNLTKKNIHDDVDAGEPIGNVGTTGVSTGPHLHFAIKYGNILGCGYINDNCQSEKNIGFNSYDNPIEFIETLKNNSLCINFDTFPSGAQVPEPTILTSQYSDSGAIFSISNTLEPPNDLVIENGSGGFFSPNDFLGMSFPNVLSSRGYSPGPEASIGCNSDLRIDFVDPFTQLPATVDSVSIRLFVQSPNQTNLNFLAKATNGSILDQDLFVVLPGTFISSYTFRVFAPGIASVETVGITGSNACTIYDNLVLSSPVSLQ